MINTCNCILKTMDEEISKSEYAEGIYSFLAVFGLLLAGLFIVFVFLPAIGYITLSVFPNLVNYPPHHHTSHWFDKYTCTNKYTEAGLITLLAFGLLFIVFVFSRFIYSILKPLFLGARVLINAFYLSIIKCFSHNNI